MNTEQQKKELLEELTRMSDCRIDSLDQAANLGALDKHYKLRDALRRLVEKFYGEWKPESVECAEVYPHLALFRDIRDFDPFGKGK